MTQVLLALLFVTVAITASCLFTIGLVGWAEFKTGIADFVDWVSRRG